MTKAYRSKFEQSFHRQNPSMEYEVAKIKYVVEHTYNPDFYDRSTDTYYETKGVFDASDRQKILAVIQQNPGIKLVLVFQNPYLKISKKSKTTYAQWATKHGINWQTISV